VAPVELRFETAPIADFIRFEAISEVRNLTHCAITELCPIPDNHSTEFDELGLIDGFYTGLRK